MKCSLAFVCVVTMCANYVTALRQNVPLRRHQVKHKRDLFDYKLHIFEDRQQTVPSDVNVSLHADAESKQSAPTNTPLSHHIRRVDKGMAVDMDLRYEIQLSLVRNLRLKWDIDPVTETITFRLLGHWKPDEFLGFGFSEYGDVINADWFVLWTDHTTTHHVEVSSRNLQIYFVASQQTQRTQKSNVDRITFSWRPDVRCMTSSSNAIFQWPTALIVLFSGHAFDKCGQT